MQFPPLQFFLDARILYDRILLFLLFFHNKFFYYLFDLHFDDFWLGPHSNDHFAEWKDKYSTSLKILSS